MMIVEDNEQARSRIREFQNEYQRDSPNRRCYLPDWRTADCLGHHRILQGTHMGLATVDDVSRMGDRGMIKDQPISE